MTRKDEADTTILPAPLSVPTTPPPPAARAPLPAPTVTPTDGKKGLGKLKKKQKKLLKDAHRPLDSWERYRALTDILDEAIDLVDLADHKARFALVIMGALNALMFIMASQTDVFDAIPPSWRPAMTAVILIYALIAVYFVIQAIESLRPRKAQPQVRYASETGLEDFPVGLRFYEDILARDLEAYRRAWRELRIGQLNAELAVQAHALAQINKAKYDALRRLYLGLQILTLMAVILMAIGSYFVLSGKARRLDAKATQQTQGSGTPLGEPQRFGRVGVNEPSGVAYHAPTGHLFVVGDDGKLSELDLSGKVIHSHPLPGNLEDLAVHTPSGDLVVLSERSSELIVYDPVAKQERRRWRLDTDAVLGRSRGDRNEGFEGLAFKPDRSGPGGGTFYLTHQRKPSMAVALAFDYNRPAGTLGADVVKARFDLDGYEDLTAVTYVPELDRLLVVSDSADLLLVLRPDGSVEREVALPGKQQEGVAVDPQGNLWLADDRDKSLLKIEGGLDALRSARSAPSEQGRGTGLRVPG
jgi:uncharacterized protein YjiK